MRDLINIVESAQMGTILTEAKSEVIEVFGYDVRVWINPSHREFLHLLQVNFGKLRGTIDTSGDLYVWDAGAAIHHNIEEGLGIQQRYRVMLESSEVILEYGVDEDYFRALRCIRRAYGNLDFEIMCDSVINDDDDEGDEEL